MKRKIVHVWIFSIAMLFAAPIEAGEISATNEVLTGIFIHSEMTTNPPERFWVADVDLKNPKLKLRVARGGDDPDGDGKWETTLMEPTKIAERENFDLVINGDFFDAFKIKDAEGTNSGYRAGQWASVVGPAVTDGKIWSAVTNARPSLVVHKNGSVAIEEISQPAPDDFEVVGGNVILVRDGKIIPHDARVRHPRTVVGLNSARDRLTILLVDGRKTSIAAGMSYDELAEEMLKLGYTDALNLDGGGSSVLAVRENGKMKILNEPTDGRERAVADVLGISVEK